MSDLTVKEFVDVVHRSQLIEKDRLIDALSKCKSDGALPAAAEEVASCLRAQGLITKWQQKNLLSGRSRGFFLGEYKLLTHLGTGGMSSVFLAQHALIQRKVAIKVLPADRGQDPAFLDRFVREARATSRLSHPNIVRVYDIDEQDGTHFMVMEYVPGKDLKAIVKQQGPLPLEKAAHYIAQAAAGLQHVHQRGLVHRDIKPANLVVNEQGVLKILDLGLARLKDEAELASLTITHAENMMGTADYLSPEQARNAHEVDHRADIYSLGCTFYYLLTGHAPFIEGTIAQRILKHQTERPRDVRAERADCPHAIADVCMTMLAKAPSDRFASAGVVVKRLSSWLHARGFENLTLDFEEDVPLRLPQDDKEKVVPAPLPVYEGPTSLADERRSRARQKVRTPMGLWIFLGVSVIICLVLFAFVLLRQ